MGDATVRSTHIDESVERNRNVCAIVTKTMSVGDPFGINRLGFFKQIAPAIGNNDGKTSLNNGENPSGRLRGKEEIPPVETVKQVLPNAELFDVLTGMILGDANLRIQKTHKQAKMKLKHSIKQKEYLLHKAEILQKITKVNIYQEKTKLKGYEKEYISYTAETRNHPIYTKLYHKWYINNRKTVTERALRPLTKKGLAYWYMDDGSLSIMRFKYQHYNKYPFFCSLNTQGFTFDEQIILQKFLQEKFNIKFRINSDGKNKYRLICGTKEGTKLIQLITPYIHPIFFYKIDLNRRNSVSNEMLLRKQDDDPVRTTYINENVEPNRNALATER